VSNKPSSYNVYYSEHEVKQLLRRLPFLLSSTLTPKNSFKSLGSSDAKVYQVRHSTFLLDLLVDLSLVWKQLPPYFKVIMSEYYLWGATDATIGSGYNIPAKSIHRVRMKAVRAILDILCKGDDALMLSLQDFKRKPRNNQPETREIITRVWRRED